MTSRQFSRLLRDRSHITWSAEGFLKWLRLIMGEWVGLLVSSDDVIKFFNIDRTLGTWFFSVLPKKGSMSIGSTKQKHRLCYGPWRARRPERRCRRTTTDRSWTCSSNTATECVWLAKPDVLKCNIFCVNEKWSYI